MSNTDSFIDEVNEEVRRDRLTGYLRRYGWIAVLAIVGIVGGTAYNEYRKATEASAAQAKGDAITEALELSDPLASAEALAAISGPENVVAGFLAAAQFEAAEDPQAAADSLIALAATPDLDPIYADLASLKALLLAGADVPDREITLEGLARPGGPYRTIAAELLALEKLSAGDQETAMTELQAILQDAEVGNQQRQRVAQLITAMGGTPELANLPFDANQ